MPISRRSFLQLSGLAPVAQVKLPEAIDPETERQTNKWKGVKLSVSSDVSHGGTIFITGSAVAEGIVVWRADTWNAFDIPPEQA